MKELSIFDLETKGHFKQYLETIYDTRNSFYKKARIFTLNGKIYLVSYSTIVAEAGNGIVTNYGKYSQTTTRHQKEFEKQVKGGNI